MAARYQQASLAGLAWALLPLAVYFVVLRSLWFNAPLLDDYYILDQAMRMREAQSAKEWLALLLAQHNEHRVAVLRLAMQIEAATLGHFDFRILTFVGNWSMAGLLVLLWLEFRSSVAAPLFAAAGFLLLQASYFEASLMPSAAIANLGVVFFSFACLYLATRAPWPSAMASVAFALLAMGSQGNGIFALPLAAAAAACAGMRRRAIAFAVIAALAGAAYFIGYQRPPHHPSLGAALADPLLALQLFLMVLGGVMPDRWGPVALGAVLLAGCAAFARSGAWRERPAAAWWIAFIVLSAAAASIGRTGMGFAQASRYAVYSSALLAILFLALCARRGPWRDGVTAAVVAGAALASVGLTAASWSNARAYSTAGKVLARTVAAAPGAMAHAYLGVQHPDPGFATTLLRAAEARGLYVPRTLVIHPTVLGPVDTPQRVAGALEHVQVEGRSIALDGWSDALPLAPGRVFAVVPLDPAPRALQLTVTQRPDIAGPGYIPDNIAAGFHAVLEYGSTGEAAEAAKSLCIFVKAPGYSPAALARADVPCLPARPSGGGSAGPAS